MQCLYCKGTMQKKTAPFDIHRKGYHLTFDSIPAWVCSQCGEILVEENEVNTIQMALKALEYQTEKLAIAA